MVKYLNQESHQSIDKYLSMSERPIFSVIIPTYNRTIFFEDALNSVLSQTVKEIEVIVVDDGSEIGHRETVVGLSLKDERVRVIRVEKNIGVSSSRNIGIKAAQGQYLTFLDDDDTMDVLFLEECLNQFNENSHRCDVAICHSTVHPASKKELFHYHVVKETLKKQPHDEKYEWEKLYLLLKYPPQINSMAFKRELFLNNSFKENLQFGEDIYLWINLLRSGCLFSIKRTREPRAFVRTHHEGHLSQPAHIDVVRYLEMIKMKYGSAGNEFLALLNLKLIMRYSVMRDSRRFTTLIAESLNYPITFFIQILNQFLLKSKITFSYLLYRYFRLDI